MPLCVNRTFFTAWFLTSATAGGVNPSAGPAACTSGDVHSQTTESAGKLALCILFKVPDGRKMKSHRKDFHLVFF